MSTRNVALDTNVFLLFLVGAVNKNAIPSHKRLQQYDANAFDILCDKIAAYDRIVVTSGCLAEVCNLVDTDPRTRAGCYKLLKQLLSEELELQEKQVPGKTIVAEQSFNYLGITDASYVALAKRGIPVITADVKLHVEALRHCPESININHMLF